jgi:hypothetical protein
MSALIDGLLVVVVGVSVVATGYTLCRFAPRARPAPHKNGTELRSSREPR